MQQANHVDVPGRPRLPGIATIVYLVFALATCLYSLHWTISVLMCVTGVLNLFLGVALWISRVDYEPPCSKHVGDTFCQTICRLCRDLVQVTRLTVMTIAPFLLAYLQGTAFLLDLVTEQAGGRALKCSVGDLQKLEPTGLARFFCQDGFVNIDLQASVPAWDAEAETKRLRRLDSDAKSWSQAARRAQESPTAATAGTGLAYRETVVPGDSRDIWGAMSAPRGAAKALTEALPPYNYTLNGGRVGFAAPIYTSLADYHSGKGPVAWAVKAGSPVKRSVCDDNTGMPGTCGMFAKRIQDRWSAYSFMPEWFGRSWGFNITHFNHNQMLAAIQEVTRKHPGKNLTGWQNPTIVVAEDLRASFGIAYSTLWVVMALLAMGLMERLVVMADSSQLMRRRPPLEAETGSGAEEPLTSYNGDFGELLARQQQYNLSPARQAHDKSGLSHQVTDLPGDVYDGTVPGSHSNLFEEAYAFWADTLGRSTRVGTSAIDDANDCSAAHDDQDSTGCSYCRQCVQCNRRKRQHNRRVVTVVVSPNSNGR